MTNRNVADDASNTNKATIADNDRFLMADSESNPNSLKEVLWSLIKSTLKTANDLLYAPITKGVTNGDSHDHNSGDGAAITEAAITMADNTTNNASTSKHGFLKKLDNDATHFMDGQGNWSTVAGVISGPQGFGDNYKFSVTVASNNITVALKTVAGNDPSAGSPVKIRIGDTYHSVTSALSVTKNAGTNWCNAGSAELATKEIDYFVYLGYNTTDGVVIGFSRIPYANKYGDFSTTSTNEKYCAISTITNAAAGDYYENVGRFAATLSAGAGYTWSVPTFTANNLINRPVFETRTLVYVPTFTGFSANPSGLYYYKVQNNIVELFITNTSGGTSNSTSFTMTAPFASYNAGGGVNYRAPLAMYFDNDTLGTGGLVTIPADSTTITLQKVNGGAWTASATKSADFILRYLLTL